jgi:pimeloyl-ACP methyl ester carboxylesterase
VSDASFFDLALLGKLGFVPGWPGEATCPPQPMVAQTAAFLDRYEAQGGRVKRHVFPGAGHSPFIETQDDFAREFVAFVEA